MSLATTTRAGFPSVPSGFGDKQQDADSAQGEYGRSSQKRGAKTPDEGLARLFSLTF